MGLLATPESGSIEIKTRAERVDETAMSRPDRAGGPSRQSGFTLVEVIVVLAVVLLLTGIAVPLIGGYVEDGRRARAEAEIRTLAAAVLKFNKDVGTWPTTNSSGAPNYLYVLGSGETKPTANPYSRGHSFATWLQGTRGDILDNHLLRNQPQGATAAAYPITGNMRWRGPYVAGSTPLDPWGRPYVVNVIAGWNGNATNHRRIFVLSAGPDGRINTPARARSTDDISGDDIGMIVNERQ